ncbi:MAG TPA: diacylglycerol kinase family protein [Arenibaculum sp.]|nr:diacylglycerol kinase family protein [Arenibaculum sp.]
MLEGEGPMRLTVIHNPTAGSGKPSADGLTETLKAHGHDLRYRSSRDPDFPAVLVEPADLVVVAGGDGTVSKVVAQLPDRNTPVAILPLGTANNIAMSLGIEGTLDDIVAGWRIAGIRRLDVGAAFGPWGRRSFVEAVGIGALARATARMEAADIEAGGAGKLHLGRSMFREALAEAEPEDLGVVVDGRALPGDLLLVEVMNIGYVGPNLLLAPSADPGDGYLDVVHVRANRRAEMLEWLDSVEGRMPPLVVLRGRRVSIAWRGAPLLLGDDFLPVPEHAENVTVETDPEGLPVLVP